MNLLIFDIVEFFKVLNQQRLLKKLLLNENQCYLLDNRELHTLTNNKGIEEDKEIEKNKVNEGNANREIEDLEEREEKQSIEKLIEYIS